MRPTNKTPARVGCSRLVRRAQRILAWRIEEWLRRQGEPEPIAGMTAGEVRAYYMGRRREAEAVIDLLYNIKDRKDTSWAAKLTPNTEGSRTRERE